MTMTLFLSVWLCLSIMLSMLNEFLTRSLIPIVRIYKYKDSNYASWGTGDL